MSIKNAISNNGINSATFNGKNYTRREVNGVVFYDISGGGASSSGGGANVTTDPNAPTGGSDGDLWYDETNGGLYVYTDSINGWIQTNGGGGTAGGASVTTGDTAPASPADGDLWFDESVSELYAYIESQTAWIQTNGGSSGGGGSSTGDVTPANPADGDLWFNTTTGKLYVYIEAQTAWIQTSGGSGGSPRAYGYWNGYSNTMVVSYNIASWTWNQGTTNKTLDVYFSNTITDIQGVLFSHNTGNLHPTSYTVVSGDRIIFDLGSWGGTHTLYFQVF